MDQGGRRGSIPWPTSRALASPARFTIYPGKSPIGSAWVEFPGGPFRGVGPTAHFLFVPSFVWRSRTRLPIDTNQIAGIIEPSLDAMGYRLVRVAVLGAGRVTLQIMAERRDDAAMTVDDRAAISRLVCALLDVAAHR